MRFSIFLFPAILYAQCSTPMPGVPVRACAIVTGNQNIITLQQQFPLGAPVTILSCDQWLTMLPYISVNVKAGIINFACAGLSNLPQVTCPESFPVPISLLAGQIYIGYQPNNITAPLHVSDGNGPSITCTGCYQDIFPAPGIGEYPIAIYTIGGTVQSTWTGYPALPAVNLVNCSAGYTIQMDVTVVYGPNGYTITCN